jgi:hypothetical protein
MQTPEDNWLVFTAGCMGARQGHAMSWLASQDLPLDAFVGGPWCTARLLAW